MDYQDRIKSLQDMLRKNPKDTKIRKTLALILSENGFTHEALAHLTLISTYTEKESSLYYNMGILYEKLKDIDSAQRAYEEAVKILPENIDAYYNLGLVYTQQKLYKDALKCFQHVLNSDDKDANTWFNTGLCYFKLDDLIQA